MSQIFNPSAGGGIPPPPLNFATHADMTAGTSLILIVNPEDANWFQRNPTTIGSQTPNTGDFTHLTSNNGQVFSAGLNSFPVTSVTALSNGYVSPNVTIRTFMNADVPASIAAGFGNAFEQFLQLPNGSNQISGSLFSQWVTPTPGNASSSMTLRVTDLGSSVDALQIFGKFLRIPFGQVVGTTLQVATPYNVLTSDYVIFANSSLVANTINLPFPINTSGVSYRIKDATGTAAVNNITVSGNGKTIDGAASFVINTNYGRVDLVYNGSQWSIL